QALVNADIALTSADAVTVSLSYAEATALTASDGSALLAANVDTLEATMTGAEAKALTEDQIAALAASGISVIDLSDEAVLLTSSQVKAFSSAGISFSDDDTVTQHAAPQLATDVATVAENKTAKVAVLANDAAFDDYDLSVTSAVVTSGDGVVTIANDGSLSVTYTGADIDGSKKATVKVTYMATDGVETAQSTLTVTFTAVTEPLTGSAKADKITGSSLNEVIRGLGGNDTLSGQGGVDTIYGGAGNDRLFGDAGNDVLKGDDGNDRLAGGAGADDLYGGSGADVFVFSKLSDTGASKAKADAVMDFRHAQKDVIDLSDLDANAKRSGDQDFDFIGSDKYSKTPGELRLDGDKSGYYLHGDVNGDGKDDFVIEIHSTKKLAASDFDL
ncbi:Ca2+-binding RTX toxin-like protein, partial [Rhizobium sp. SG_E_25_P2]|nr:Ca2+-binding RTX toxin-like protein [Rhizobium sp. SG_E_25_P2]